MSFHLQPHHIAFQPGATTSGGHVLVPSRQYSISEPNTDGGYRNLSVHRTAADAIEAAIPPRGFEVLKSDLFLGCNDPSDPTFGQETTPSYTALQDAWFKWRSAAREAAMLTDSESVLLDIGRGPILKMSTLGDAFARYAREPPSPDTRMLLSKKMLGVLPVGRNWLSPADVTKITGIAYSMHDNDYDRYTNQVQPLHRPDDDSQEQRAHALPPPATQGNTATTIDSRRLSLLSMESSDQGSGKYSPAQRAGLAIAMPPDAILSSMAEISSPGNGDQDVRARPVSPTHLTAEMLNRRLTLEEIEALESTLI